VPCPSNNEVSVEQESKVQSSKFVLLYLGTISLNASTISSLTTPPYTEVLEGCLWGSLYLMMTREQIAALTKNSTVSVVDDDESMRRMLSRGIQAAGFDVAVFNSAEEFLDSGNPSNSDCLVLDVDLPGMNGIELQQHLNESGTDISIIFMSGHADERMKKRALEAGAAGFFSKPLSINTLVATIRTLQQQLNPIWTSPFYF